MDREWGNMKEGVDEEWGNMKKGVDV